MGRAIRYALYWLIEQCIPHEQDWELTPAEARGEEEPVEEAVS